MKKRLVLTGILSLSLSLSYAAEIAYVPQVANAGAAQNAGGAGVAWPDGQSDNPDRFTPGSGATADCVTDNLTGLVWSQNANLVGAMNWANANIYFNLGAGGPNDGAGLCGYTDWRLPTVNELKSLVNYGDAVGPDNYLTDSGFINVQDGSYWSSNVTATLQDGGWAVDMGNGSVFEDGQGVGYFVWPVRGGQ